MIHTRHGECGNGAHLHPGHVSGKLVLWNRNYGQPREEGGGEGVWQEAPREARFRTSALRRRWHRQLCSQALAELACNRVFIAGNGRRKCGCCKISWGC